MAFPSIHVESMKWMISVIKRQNLPFSYHFNNTFQLPLIKPARHRKSLKIFPVFLGAYYFVHTTSLSKYRHVILQ